PGEAAARHRRSGQRDSVQSASRSTLSPPESRPRRVLHGRVPPARPPRPPANAAWRRHRSRMWSARAPAAVHPMTPRFGHRVWRRVWHRVWALALAATLAPMPSAAAAPKGKTKQKAKVETPAPDPEPEEILVIEEEEPEAPEESLPDTRPPAQAIIEDMALVGDGKIEDPQIAMSKLRELLAKAEAYPFEVADELGAHRARVRALLALAQLLIESGDVDGAIANIDEAIRVVRGDPLPPGIGPALEQLIFERLAAPE